jgi:hypothetical protein
VADNGNVGIGTGSPGSKLHVTGRTYLNNGSAQALGIDGSSPFIQFYHNGVARSYIQNTSDINMTVAASGSIILSAINTGIGTSTPSSKLHVAGRTLMQGSNELLAFQSSGTNMNISFYHNASQRSYIQQADTNLVLGVNNGNLHFTPTGQVAIGEIVPAATGYKLTVDGKVICEELKVELKTAWPDYVFNPGYKLMPLDQLREFILSKNRLPNIPPATTLEQEGMEVGDMQKRTMEKIEELTLYILQLEERIKLLESKKK